MQGKKWGSRFAMLAIAGLAATACGGEEQAAEQPAVEEPAAEAPAPETPAATTGQIPAELQGVVTPEQVAMGQQIFTGKGICMTCHGPDAAGTTLAPNLTDDEWLWVTATDPKGKYDQIVQRIHEGVPQPKQYPAPMPPMGGASLTDEEVNAVAAYIVTL